ncbi:DUF6544 family protein [Acetohalobium arabaticum]|uniref:Uncharacterized protein n=1 Tax=Acetohalobium arabaticum (strain ATCC 49924 / DSM 5501 / Z-7288) TaxID=574087 RepID=D9QQX3_ACEAZ|nr:DUF6544 family protein [Acetohalobium arabaticum]ADL12914.1 conserved hypothetical protein [Acetohalobium arabaticum DSM 5501]
MIKIVFEIFSTLLIIPCLVFVASVIANILFNQQVKQEVKELFNNTVENNNGVIQESDLEELPNSVQKWLEYSQVVGKERIRSVRLKQKAVMRIEEDKSWMSVKAEQYFTVDKPGFIWKARIKAAPFFYIVGRDKYQNGRGSMLIKILSLITVADSKGQEMDQATLVRYLAEIVWFPTAALSSYIEWEEIDSTSAKAIMSYRGVTASGVFEFDSQGRVINFTAERYMEKNGEYDLETWVVSMDEYKECNGVCIPVQGAVTWQLETGDFNWFQFEITEIEYNKPVIYEKF